SARWARHRAVDHRTLPGPFQRRGRSRIPAKSDSPGRRARLECMMRDPPEVDRPPSHGVMMRPLIAYQELLRRSREQVLLDSCSGLLNWDEQTYMPRSGAAHRAQQLALLAGMRHERATDPRIGELLSVLEDSDLLEDPESPEAVNVREWRR